METSILIAIITGFTSLILGIVNFIGNKQTLNATQRLEVEKYKLQEKQNLAKIRSEFFIKNIESIDSTIKLLQSVIDKITILIYQNNKKEILSETVVTEFQNVRQEYFKLYEINISNYVDDEKEIIHFLKSTLLDIESLILDILENQRYIKINIENIDKLEKYKIEIREQLNILRDLKNTRISTHLSENFIQ